MIQKFLFCFILSLPCCVFGQSDYSKFDFNVVLGTNLYQKQFAPVMGLNGELHINSNWSVLYNYQICGLSDYEGYLHLPMSLYAVGPVTSFLTQNSYTISDFLGSLAVGLLTALIPEGVAYHYPVAYRLDLSGFVNPLGLGLVMSNNPAEDQRLRYNATAGVKLSYYTRFGLLASASTQLNLLRNFGVFPSAGVSLGYAFGNRHLGESDQ